MVSKFSSGLVIGCGLAGLVGKGLQFAVSDVSTATMCSLINPAYKEAAERCNVGPL